MKTLFTLFISMFSISTVANADIQNVDILVYDSSIESDCTSTREEGCIRMKVSLNDGEETYTWLANSGGEGYRLTPMLVYKDGKPVDISGYRPSWYEGRSTPSYNKRAAGTLHDEDYITYRLRYKMPFFIRILNSEGRDGSIGIFGNDRVNGSTSHQMHISVSRKNISQLSEWISEARSNGGNGYVTVTVPRLK